MSSEVAVEIHFFGHPNHSLNTDSEPSANISMNERLFWVVHSDMFGKVKCTFLWKRKTNLHYCHIHRDWLLHIKYFPLLRPITQMLKLNITSSISFCQSFVKIFSAVKTYPRIFDNITPFFRISPSYVMFNFDLLFAKIDNLMW